MFKIVKAHKKPDFVLAILEFVDLGVDMLLAIIYTVASNESEVKMCQKKVALSIIENGVKPLGSSVFLYPVKSLTH